MKQQFAQTTPPTDTIIYEDEGVRLGQQKLLIKNKLGWLTPRTVYYQDICAFDKTNRTSSFSSYLRFFFFYLLNRIPQSQDYIFLFTRQLIIQQFNCQDSEKVFQIISERVNNSTSTLQMKSQYFLPNNNTNDKHIELSFFIPQFPSY